MIEQILSDKMLFFNIVTNINCAFLLAMKKRLHAVLIKICASRGDEDGLFHDAVLEGSVAQTAAYAHS